MARYLLLLLGCWARARLRHADLRACATRRCTPSRPKKSVTPLPYKRSGLWTRSSTAAAAGDVLQNKVAPALAQGGDAAAETLKTKVVPALADGAEAFQTSVVPAVGDAIITGAAGAGDAFYASIQAARDAGVSDSALATGAVIWVAVTGAAIARKATPPPPPPPTPAEKAAMAAQSAVNAGFKAFEVVQGRPYTPLKSKAVEDARSNR